MTSAVGQLDIFAVHARRTSEPEPARPSVPPPSAHEQEQQLQRVTGRIGASVLRFCRSRIGSTFTAADLAGHVVSECGGAPGSADRVMRDLRRKGLVDVELVDRAASLYRIRAAAAEGSWPGT